MAFQVLLVLKVLLALRVLLVPKVFLVLLVPLGLKVSLVSPDLPVPQVPLVLQVPPVPMGFPVLLVLQALPALPVPSVPPVRLVTGRQVSRASTGTSAATSRTTMATTASRPTLHSRFSLPRSTTAPTSAMLRRRARHSTLPWEPTRRRATPSAHAATSLLPTTTQTPGSSSSAILNATSRTIRHQNNTAVDCILGYLLFLFSVLYKHDLVLFQLLILILYSSR